MKTVETSTSTEAAAVAEQGAPVAPGKAASTKATAATKNAPKAKKGAKETKTATKKSATKPTARNAPKAKATAIPREFSKKAIVLGLLGRKDGATLAEIAKATDWRNHYADVQIMPTCVGNPACGAVIAAMESA